MFTVFLVILIGFIRAFGVIIGITLAYFALSNFLKSAILGGHNMKNDEWPIE